MAPKTQRAARSLRCKQRGDTWTARFSDDPHGLVGTGGTVDAAIESLYQLQNRKLRRAAATTDIQGVEADGSE